jgi:hypothetical protein
MIGTSLCFRAFVVIKPPDTGFRQYDEERKETAKTAKTAIE